MTQAFQVPLTPTQIDWPAICAKELLAIVLWIERFGHEHVGSILLCGTDNAGNVFTVNRLRVDASDLVMTDLLQRLLSACDRFSMDVIVWWCPRVLNGISDDLSKSLSFDAVCRVAQFHGLVLRQ